MDGMFVGMIVGLCSVLALMIWQIAALRRRIGELPLSVWSLARKERAGEQDQALAALHDAAERKVSTLVAGIQSYHNKLAADLREESANAELRARIVERHAEEAGVALDAAIGLVNTLRELIDNAGTESRARRAAIEQRPMSLSPERPRSGPILPPEPAHAAAGLTRPGASSTPPKKKTLLGIHPPPLPVASDGDRPSEEELTQVVDRPKTLPRVTDKTLPSMTAVVPPSKMAGGS